MRYLKNKIAQSLKARSIAHAPKQPKDFNKVTEELKSTPIKRRRIPGYSFTGEKVKETKNLVINYGRAISGFALSKLADSYLEPLVKREQVTLDDFKKYIQGTKEMIGGISTFRQILIVTEKDTPQEASYKKLYSYIAEVFLKYFSVNWIIHGKMAHKEVYLKYRFPMLRRIKNPEMFTYLKNPKLNQKRKTIDTEISEFN